jgi:hypothetical protein
MASQTYDTHVHRPTLTGVGYLCLVIAIVGFTLRWLYVGGRVTMAIGLLGLIGCQLALLLISRSYITRLQDRIIRLEMRVRGAALLTPEQQRHLTSLRIKQIAALRFASDAELAELVERSAREQLPPDSIKRAIKTWIPDLDRT